MNIFELATREKFRFPSKVGALTLEQLWDLPLTSAKNASLDDTARTINTELKAAGEESFVMTNNPVQAVLSTKLDIVKHVIAVRLAENEATRATAARKAEKEKLMQILGDKQDAQLMELSVDELMARIGELG